MTSTCLPRRASRSCGTTCTLGLKKGTTSRSQIASPSATNRSFISTEAAQTRSGCCPSSERHGNEAPLGVRMSSWEKGMPPLSPRSMSTVIGSRQRMPAVLLGFSDIKTATKDARIPSIWRPCHVQCFRPPIRSRARPCLLHDARCNRGPSCISNPVRFAVQTTSEHRDTWPRMAHTYQAHSIGLLIAPAMNQTTSTQALRIGWPS